MSATPKAMLLQYPRKPQAAPISVKQQQQPPRSPRITMPSPTPPSSAGFYDVVWQTGSLGMRFTPNERDEPVVCQITPKASDAVQRSPVSVGDVVVAVQVHSIGGPMISIATLQELVQVFQHESLPITVRFRSRGHEKPEAIALVDIARSYTYTWQSNQPLGVSLAMDPCSLHTIITSIDTNRIAPEFLPLDPTPGDILISIRDLDRKVDLDLLRFDHVVETLKSFPRPCKLTFARLHEDVPLDHGQRPPSPSMERFERMANGPNGPGSYPPPSPSRRAQVEAAHAPMPSPRQLPRRPAPLMKRQSFTVEEMQRQKMASQEDAKKQAQRDARFYKILYNGGHIGLVLHDANLDLKGKPKKNGYYAYIKKITNKHAVEGLDQASEGDELIAIGQHDLHHLSFAEVQRELASINTPTSLIFQRKPQSNGPSVGASLVDGLLLFLM